MPTKFSPNLSASSEVAKQFECSGSETRYAVLSDVIKIYSFLLKLF